MCWYKVDTCPYPHHDSISALIFYPGHASKWEKCDKPKPWGRLSCGNLIVQHTDLRRENTHPNHPADCKWCTAVLKLEATKSKEIQQQAQKEIEKLEDAINTNPKTRTLQEKIEALERELASVRNDAWKLRITEGMDGETGEWEMVKGA